MSSKPRPSDGPGANGLRGGSNTYSLKTAMGGWIEDVGGASEYKRGFTSKSFLTECQHQQTGRDLQQTPEFGAGLPQRYVLPRKSTDIFNPSCGPDSSTWQTNSQVMIKTAGQRYAEHSNHAPLPNLDAEALEKYRSSWTSDTAASRDMRYQTESRRAGNGGVADRFLVNSIRLLPGSPMAFEKLREKLLERYGILALTALRHACGTNATMSGTELHIALAKNAGIKISSVDFNQLLAYLTPKDTFNRDNFLRVFMGLSSLPFDKSAPEIVYRSMCESFGRETFAPADIAALMNEADNGEVVDGLRVFLSAYATSDQGEIDEASFIQLHADMYNSSVPSNATYEAIASSLWQ